MTTTVERPSSVATNGSGPPSAGGAAAPVPTPPKARRRWGLFAAMAAVVCLGALGNVWLHQATTNSTQVVAARSTIERGTVISRDQLMTVQIGSDPALKPVSAGQLESLVGKRAAVDVAAGSLLTGESITDQIIPAQGHSLVGVGVTPAMMPGAKLVAGDRIRIVATPGQQGLTDAAAKPVSVAAVVVSTATGADTTGQGAQTIITVDVPSADAPQLASMASTGKVAIVLDSRDR